MTKLNILVTGGAGFIGSHLCDQLVAEGHQITVIDNMSAGDQNVAELTKQGIEVVVGDIGDYETVNKVTAGKDVVFHLAAMNRAGRSIAKPLEAHSANATGTINVFEAARQNKVKKVVFVSSSSVLGGSEQMLKEDDPYHPLHPYGVGKACGEMYANIYHHLFNLPVVTLRYFSIYGPRQRGDIDYAAVTAKFVHLALSGEPLTVYGDGEQLRNYTYVSDAVDATVAAMKSDEAIGKIINIANNNEYTIKDIVNAVTNSLGQKVEVKNVPLPAPEPKRNFPDLTLSKTVLKWSPKITLEEGVEKYVQWYKNRI